MAYGIGYGLAKMAEGLTGGAMQAQQANEQKRDRFVKETLSLASIMDPEYAQKFVDKRLPDYGIVLKRPQMKPQNVSITLPGGETIEGERAKISDLMGRATKSGKPLVDLLNDPQALRLAAANGVSVSRPKPGGAGKLYQTAEGLLPMDQAMGKMPYQKPWKPTAPPSSYREYQMTQRDPGFMEYMQTERDRKNAPKPMRPEQVFKQIRQAQKAINDAKEGKGFSYTNPDGSVISFGGGQLSGPELESFIQAAENEVRYLESQLPAEYRNKRQEATDPMTAKEQAFLDEVRKALK